MARLDVFLLGPFRAELDGQPVMAFESAKERALLAYLAAETAYPHPREALAELLWPERPAGVALANLRHSLASLRKSIDAADADPAYLLIGPATLQFNPELHDCVDFLRFAALLEGQPPVRAACEAAVLLYRDRFLEGFVLADSPEFDHWIAAKRDWAETQVEAALAHLVRYSAEQGDFAKAADWTQRQLELEPWNEELHRQAMWLLAQHGRRTAALHQFEHCVHMLAAELDTAPQPATLALAEQIRNGAALGPLIAQDGKPLALASVQAQRVLLHNFPPPPTPFVGRIQELAQVAGFLAKAECRLLTIVGPGGTGKTRLALQAAQSAATSYADGAWFVDLTSLSTVRTAPTVILHSLNGPDCEAAEAKGELLRYLRDKQILVLFDSCEHLADLGMLLDELAQNTPGLQILATSRARLNLQREWLLPLQGLTAPQTGQGLPPAAPNGDPHVVPLPVDLAAFDATQLFVQCVRRLQPDFGPSATDAALIAGICDRLDGIPLAIELAAALTRNLPLAELAAQVENDLGVLRTSFYDVSVRHRSMHAVFDHSWRMLTVGEQRLLRKLSLFRNGFTYVAASTIVGATLADLSGLADKSWLRLEPSGRYAMHELTRQYCAEHLEADPVDPGDDSPEQLQSRFGRYFCTFLHRAMTSTNFRPDALDDLRADLRNLHAAWKWTVWRGDLRSAADMVLSLYFMADMLGWYRFVLGEYDTIADQLAPYLDMGANAAARRTVCQILGGIEYIRGVLYVHLGLLDEARTHLAEGRRQAALYEPGEAAAEIELLLDWLEIMILANEGRFADSYNACLAVLEQFRAAGIEFTLYGRALGSEFWQAHTLDQLALLQLALGDYATARSWIDQAIALREQIGEVRFRASSYRTVAQVLLLQGEDVAAEEQVQISLHLSSTVGDRIGIAAAHVALGRVLCARRQFVLGNEHCRLALATARQAGDHRLLMDSLVQLGQIELDQGNPAAAAALLMEAIHAFEQLATPHSNKVAGALLGLGWAALAQGDLVAARSDFEQALAARGALAWEQRDMQAGLAHVLAAEGKSEAASDLCERLMRDGATAAVTKGKVRQLLAGCQRIAPHSDTTDHG